MKKNENKNFVLKINDKVLGLLGSKTNAMVILFWLVYIDKRYKHKVLPTSQLLTETNLASSSFYTGLNDLVNLNFVKWENGNVKLNKKHYHSFNRTEYFKVSFEKLKSMFAIKICANALMAILKTLNGAKFKSNKTFSLQSKERHDCNNCNFKDRLICNLEGEKWDNKKFIYTSFQFTFNFFKNINLSKSKLMKYFSNFKVVWLFKNIFNIQITKYITSNGKNKFRTFQRLLMIKKVMWTNF
ncbi:hypothetical protein ACW95P_04835 [Candidatus Mycoplasma pogonae]